MHQPRPHGTFGERIEDGDAAELEALARRLTNFKSISEIDSLRLTRTLPSGAVATAQDMGGVFKVLVRPALRTEEGDTRGGQPSVFVPMLVSGCIDNGRTKSGRGITAKLTETTRKRLVHYAPNEALPPQAIEMQRFVVRHSPRVSELVPRDTHQDEIITQYDNLRPTWYSGAMAQVVQIVGGYGKRLNQRQFKQVHDRAAMRLPESVAGAIFSELGGSAILPGYTGMPPESGEILYDYKFSHTNCVGFDTKKKPWLLRISKKGVYAMPLPLVPATTTKAFRRYIEAVGDGEILWALNRFGGMPSGETFPSRTDDFGAWVRAGAIIKVCDTADFYEYSMYSSSIGWSVNSSGTEGINTCYHTINDYTSNEYGISTGLTYKLKLSFGAVKDEEGPAPMASDPQSVAEMTAYFRALWPVLGKRGVRGRAVKYKLQRIAPEMLAARANQFYRFAADSFGDTSVTELKAQQESDFLDELVMEPIATHTGSVTLISAGYIHFGIPTLKLPEPYWVDGGCISFATVNRPKVGMPLPDVADTIVLGYYVGDQRKVVRYFLDNRRYSKEPEGFEGCLTVGSWSATETSSDVTLRGELYTSDFDEREAAPDSKVTKRLVGTDLGFDTTPFFKFEYYFSRAGRLWRNRYYKHINTREEISGYAKRIAVCFPFMHRNAILHASEEVVAGQRVVKTASFGTVRDPTSYVYFTDHWYFAWHGGLPPPVHGGDVSSSSSGAAPVPVYPKDGVPVWVVRQDYQPGGCSDFADHGSWITTPADYTWLIHPDSNSWHHEGGGGPPSGDVSEKEIENRYEKDKRSGQLSMNVGRYVEVVHRNVPAVGYFASTGFDLKFYRDATEVVAGNAEYANIMVGEPGESDNRVRRGFTRVADHKTAHHFIGVINE